MAKTQNQGCPGLSGSLSTPPAHLPPPGPFYTSTWTPRRGPLPQRPFREDRTRRHRENREVPTGPRVGTHGRCWDLTPTWPGPELQGVTSASHSPRPFVGPCGSPSSALCCGVTASSLLASLAMERVIRPLRRPWLLAVLRPRETTASFSSLSSPEVSSVFSLRTHSDTRGHSHLRRAPQQRQSSTLCLLQLVRRGRSDRGWWQH